MSAIEIHRFLFCSVVIVNFYWWWTCTGYRICIRVLCLRSIALWSDRGCDGRYVYLYAAKVPICPFVVRPNQADPKNWYAGKRTKQRACQLDFITKRRQKKPIYPTFVMYLRIAYYRRFDSIASVRQSFMTAMAIFNYPYSCWVIHEGIHLTPVRRICRDTYWLDVNYWLWLPTLLTKNSPGFAD